MYLLCRHTSGWSVLHHCKGPRFGLLYVLHWCWLDLSCTLFPHLEFYFGSGVCFWNILPAHPDLPRFGSCAFRAHELNLLWVQLNTKMHLMDASDARQLLTGVWFLGQKKACSEYMALPHPKIYVVWMSSTQPELFCCTDLILSGSATC